VTLLAKDMAQQGALLEWMVLESQQAALSRATEALADHRLVRLVGIGSSRHVAGYGAACLEVLAGVPTTLLPAAGAGVPLPRFGPEQLLVLVSQSGQTPALLSVAADARAAGATVLALTNTPGSPLEDAADLVLQAAAGPESVVPATKSVTASMLLLRALAAPMDSAAVGRLAALVTGLVDDASGQVAELASTHPLPALVVCGGFAGQWVADEVAIKLAEMAAHLAVPESVVDFLHGPAAVAAPALAFLDPRDPNAADVTSRPSVLTVGPSPHFSLPLSSCGDPSLDPVVQVVAGQCLALQWACSRGVDPDDPRGLQKVTLTR
jgi:glucosamine--fructose-6-phosphate aminotransferase (isomerizing)